VHAARKKIQHEKEISSGARNEHKSGRATASANGSLRCRAPRVDETPVNSPIQSTGPASFFCARRRRFAVR
jgi:hypothetical protein